MAVRGKAAMPPAPWTVIRLPREDGRPGPWVAIRGVYQGGEVRNISTFAWGGELAQWNQRRKGVVDLLWTVQQQELERLRTRVAQLEGVGRATQPAVDV